MPSRESAIARAQGCFDDGATWTRCAPWSRCRPKARCRSAGPTCAATARRPCPPLMPGMGFVSQVLDNPDPAAAPSSSRAASRTRRCRPCWSTAMATWCAAWRAQWTDGLDPWAVTVDGDRWYGRGTVDNKGQHLIAIEALRAVLAERGRARLQRQRCWSRPARKSGSPGLREFLRAAPRPAARRMSSSASTARARPPSCRSCASARAAASPSTWSCDFATDAHHSGHWGGVLDRPRLRAGACAGLHRHAARRHPGAGLEAGRRAAGRAARHRCAWCSRTCPACPKPIADWGEPGLTKAERIFAWTSVIVLAVTCGHPDAPTNAVQGRARARLQVRHTVDVPGRDHRARAAPAPGRARLRRMCGSSPALERDMFPAQPHRPRRSLGGRVAKSMQRTANRAPNIVPNSSGSTPSDIFLEELGAPVHLDPEQLCRLQPARAGRARAGAAAARGARADGRHLVGHRRGGGAGGQARAALTPPPAARRAAGCRCRLWRNPRAIPRPRRRLSSPTAPAASPTPSRASCSPMWPSTWAAAGDREPHRRQRAIGAAAVAHPARRLFGAAGGRDLHHLAAGAAGCRWTTPP